MKTHKVGHEEFIFNEEETKEEDLESFRPLEQTKISPKEADKENMAQPLPQSSIHSQRQRRQAQGALSEINLNSNIELSKTFSNSKKNLIFFK